MTRAPGLPFDPPAARVEVRARWRWGWLVLSWAPIDAGPHPIGRHGAGAIVRDWSTALAVLRTDLAGDVLFRVQTQRGAR